MQLARTWSTQPSTMSGKTELGALVFVSWRETSCPTFKKPRPWLARAVMLGARIVTAMVVGSGALLGFFLLTDGDNYLRESEKDERNREHVEAFREPKHHDRKLLDPLACQFGPLRSVTCISARCSCIRIGSVSVLMA